MCVCIHTHTHIRANIYTGIHTPLGVPSPLMPKLRSAGLAEACQEAKEHPGDPAEGRDSAEQMQEGGRAPLVLGDGY